MWNLRSVAMALLLSGAAACSNSGDFKSDCTLSCALADGGTLQSLQGVACCGEHDNPTHPGEQGSACTTDWVIGHAQQLCQARSFGAIGPDGGLTTIVCPASQFQCSCSAPSTYPSSEGCD
jgi:hypothetical protein